MPKNKKTEKQKSNKIKEKKPRKPMSRGIKITLIAIVSVISAIILAALVYVGYVFISYSRLPDRLECEPINVGESGSLSVGKEYVAVTQNIGFGAYTPEFTFFMDGGTESWAQSYDSVISCVNKAADTIEGLSPDFVLIQEVDTDSTRSYHIDQRDILTKRFGEYSSLFAVNYHSAFLAYPPLQPHGASNSGILTLSKYNITSAVRRSLPISTGISKFLDLDRCYSVSRIPVENGKELVIYNVHMSAYGGSPEIREAQMKMLFSDMKAEYSSGNYVVCGGDFNHDFTGDSLEKLNGERTDEFEWAQPFPEDMLPGGIYACDFYNGDYAPTCRNCDVPYKEGNFTVIVDGFLVSDNVEVTWTQNIDTGFEYSDHNPVMLKFKLK